MEYHSEFYDKMDDTEQRIRLSDGCYRSCWNCYAPKEVKFYDIPEIQRNKIIFYDMNFLHAYPDPIKAIEKLGNIKVNKRVVYYDFQCGLDFTLLTPELCAALKKGRFGRFNNKRNYCNGIRVAWDRELNEKDIFVKAIKMLKEAGYRRLQVFMLTNGKQISFDVCVDKLRVLRDLRIEVGDCWYDNQKRGSIKPTYWTQEECDIFGNMCRSHNVAILQRQYDAMDRLYNYHKCGVK